MKEPTCKLCTLDGYERVAQTAHFVVLTGAGREDPLFVTPRAHIRLMEIHPLFAAEMWQLVRDVAEDKGLVFMSGADAGAHGYFALSVMREADHRWKTVAA